MIKASRAGLAVALLASSALLGFGQAYASPTSPDHGFDSDGELTIHSASHNEVLGDIRGLPNGKTLVLTETTDEPAFELYRLLKDGSPDSSFGVGDGVFGFALGANYDDVRMVVDPHTGKIYITTFLDDGPSFPTTVWRINANGTLDLPYGGANTGHVVFSQRLVEGLAAVRGGKLLMVGGDFAAHTANTWRLKNNGHRDSKFGNHGTKVLSTNTNDEATSVVTQPDGKIVVAGGHYDPATSTLRVFRLTSNGSLDHSFSGDGRAFINPSSAGVTSSTVWTPDVLLRPDGRTVYAAGLNQNNGSGFNSILVAGLTKSGKPDPKFGKHVYNNLAETWGSAALQRDGKLVVSATTSPLGPSNAPAVARFTASGNLDHSWSGDGVLNLVGYGDTSRVSINPQGRVLVGYTIPNADYDVQLSAFRGTPTPSCHGKLATQFGGAGRDAITGTSGNDVLVGLGGDDKLSGLGGHDLLCGVGGDDKLLGGPGRDGIYGQAGNDTLVGGPGRDTLVGGSGRNVIRP